MSTQNTQVAVRYGENILMRDDGSLSFKSVADILDYADLMAKAYMLPKGMTKEGAAIAIIAGAGLGLNPFSSVQGIASINGRPAVWGDTMLAIVRASGQMGEEKVEYFNAEGSKEIIGVRYTVYRKGIVAPFVGTFSLKEAQAAKLTEKDSPWKTYPKRMMLSRARAFALRDGFADILKGLRCREEEEDIQRTEKAMVEVSPEAVTPAPYQVEQTAKPKVTAESLIRAAAKSPKTPKVEAAPEAENAPKGEIEMEVA